MKLVRLSLLLLACAIFSQVSMAQNSNDRANKKPKPVKIQPATKATKAPISTKETNAEKAETAPAVETAPAATETPKVTMGKISQIQQALRAKGYDPGPIDNVLGAKTREALAKFQKDNNLPVGNLNVETMRALGVE